MGGFGFCRHVGQAPQPKPPQRDFLFTEVQMTIQIPLTQGKFAIVDDIDADLANFKWYAAKSRNTFYANRTMLKNEKKIAIQMHRLILQRIHQENFHSNEKCDHINGDGLDNRRCNLRISSIQENSRNQKINKRNKSGYKGVFWDKTYKKWKAQIRTKDKSKHLGYFDNPKEAYEAYKRAAIKYHGEFARFE